VRNAALARAFELAGNNHRVFLTHPHNHTSVPADRAESGRRSTVELIPSFKRLRVVQDRFAIDEPTVTRGTD